MNTKHLNTFNTTNKFVFLIGFTGIALIIALDKLYWFNSVLKEGLPNFSVLYTIRSIIILISVIALFCSLISRLKPKLEISKVSGLSVERLSILMTLFFSIVTSFLFIFQPSLFHTLSQEDNIIEWGSVILLFGSCIITIFSLFKNIQVLKNSKFTALSLAFLSFIFFIMAMEEASWFQRVLEFESPKAFVENQQHEMNLHNFATDFVESIYYFGTFVFLVVLPFIRFLFPSLLNYSYLKTFIARPFIGIIASIACAYNFDMWNIVFTQIAFFGSLLVLLAFAIFCSVRVDRLIIFFTIIIIIATQILFLVNGTNFDRIWEITEYKEFFIPLALFIYSCDVYFHINRTV